MGGVLPTLEKLFLFAKKAGAVNENHARFDSPFNRLIRADYHFRRRFDGSE